MAAGGAAPGDLLEAARVVCDAKALRARVLLAAPAAAKEEQDVKKGEETAAKEEEEEEQQQVQQAEPAVASKPQQHGRTPAAPAQQAAQQPPAAAPAKASAALLRDAAGRFKGLQRSLRSVWAYDPGLQRRVVGFFELAEAEHARTRAPEARALMDAIAAAVAAATGGGGAYAAPYAPGTPAADMPTCPCPQPAPARWNNGTTALFGIYEAAAARAHAPAAAGPAAAARGVFAAQGATTANWCAHRGRGGRQGLQNKLWCRWAAGAASKGCSWAGSRGARQAHSSPTPSLITSNLHCFKQPSQGRPH